jgi:hypothetical protein
VASSWRMGFEPRVLAAERKAMSFEPGLTSW